MASDGIKVDIPHFTTSQELLRGHYCSALDSPSDTVASHSVSAFR